jgi:hypothetical protein
MDSEAKRKKKSVKSGWSSIALYVLLALWMKQKVSGQEKEEKRGTRFAIGKGIPSLFFKHQSTRRS